MNITYIEWMQKMKQLNDDGRRAAETGNFLLPHGDPGGDRHMIGENQAYRDGYRERMIKLNGEDGNE